MFDINVEIVGEVAVVQCMGRLVDSDAAFRLRDIILSHSNARLVVVDLSEVDVIEGGGLGMLAYIQRWARDHNLKLKLFNPSNRVREGLGRAWMPTFDIATTDELIALLSHGDRRELVAHP
ncbi:MAG TPA: STAS domain-containing protein [Terriglobales bacterium]|nr:STAS domain-containing protein [Terriglobales bacterium]